MIKVYFYRCLAFSMLILLSNRSVGQYKVLNWGGETALNTFLVQQMHQQYLHRSVALTKSLSSRSAILSYRDSCRRRYKNIIGTFPQAGNLNVQAVGKIQQEGYHIEKIIFESFAKHHVTANLYVPEGKGPFPAVLFFCGHENEGKTTESYQKTAILFAKHGFVVLMTDPISQGERYQTDDGKALDWKSTTEHIILNSGSNLVGTSVAAYELWDNIRSLDYLVTRSEVDKDRIGCLGNSGGSTQTAYMMAYDDRIKVSALCSCVLDSDHGLDVKGPSDGCVPIPGHCSAQLEDADYFTMFAPKPSIVLAGRYDFVNYNRVVDAYHENKLVYNLMGQPDKINMLTVDDGHGISKPKREAAVSWFRRWLCDDGSAIHEGELTVLTAKELNCTAAGQVNNAYADEITVQQHNLNLADQSSAQRKAWFQGDLNKYKEQIKKVVGIHYTHEKVVPEWMGDITKDGYTVKKLILRKTGEMPIPCLLIYPEHKTAKSKLLLWLPGQGKDKIADSTALIKDCLQNGNGLMIADLRGFGEETERPLLKDSPYYNPDYRESNLAIELGKPLTGQRTQDIFTLLDYMDTDTRLKDLPVEISASGIVGPSAIHAMVLDKRILKLNLYHTITSYYSLLKTPQLVNQFPYVIPGVLNYYDLPDLVKVIGSDKVKFYNN